MVILLLVDESQKTKVKTPTLRTRRGGWGTRNCYCQKLIPGQKKIACDEPTESLPSGDFVLIQFFEGLMPSVTVALISSGGLFNPLNECLDWDVRRMGGNGRSPSMRSGAHSTETKAKAETDSSSQWLVGMTAKKYKDENPTLRRN